MSVTRTAGRRGPRTASRRATARESGPRVEPAPTVTAEPDADPDEGGAQRQRRRPARRARTSSPDRSRAPRHRLLLACVAALSAGLVGVLLLNTIISQGAFRQYDLEVELILLAEEEEALMRAVQLAESPLSVEKEARKLGMVPAGSAVFFDLESGEVLGEPVPAPSPTGPVSFKDAPGVHPKPKRSASASPSASDGPVAPGEGPPAAAEGEAATDAAVPAAEPGPAPAPTASGGPQ